MARGEPGEIRRLETDRGTFAGPGDPSREIAMVIVEFGRGDAVRQRTLYDAYLAAGGPCCVRERADLGLAVAQLYHFGHRHVTMWVALLLVAPLWRFRRVAPRAAGRGGRPLEAQLRLLRDRQATIVYATVFVEGAAFFGGLGYLGALLHDDYGLSLDEVGLVLVLDGVALLVTSRLIGRIAPHLGENRMILTGALFMGGAYLLMFRGRELAGRPARSRVARSGLRPSPLDAPDPRDRLCPEARGTAISLFAFWLFIGSAAGTAVLGQLVESRGYGALLLSCGVALVLLGVTAPRLTAPAPAAS